MHTDTAGQRKQMMVKHAELAALWKMKKPDQTASQAKHKELNALRDQMREKMTAFRLEVKEIGPDCPMGTGHGVCMGPGCMVLVLDHLHLRLPPSKAA